MDERNSVRVFFTYIYAVVNDSQYSSANVVAYMDIWIGVFVSLCIDMECVLSCMCETKKKLLYDLY